MLPDAEYLKTIVLYIFSVFLFFCVCLFVSNKRVYLVIVIPLWPEAEKANQIFGALIFNVIGQLGITKYLMKPPTRKTET